MAASRTPSPIGVAGRPAAKITIGTDHTAVSDAQLAVLSEDFTVPQVVELLTWIVFEHAGQMFGALIGDEPATEEERTAFAAAVAARPAPTAGPASSGT